MVYNPFSAWPITGSWLDHASYSAGGIDYPLSDGTPLPAPGSGTLRTSGGSGEWAAGYIGSAGRRSILTLDAPAGRQIQGEPSPPEGPGPMVAIVFQHQSAFGAARHYAEGEILGWSGNSNGTTSGGDYHLHIHGLNSAGQRVDFTKFIGEAEPEPEPEPEEHPGRKYPAMRSIQDPRDSRWWAIGNGDPQPFGNNVLENGTYVNPAVIYFQQVWGPGASGMSTQAFLDAILASTPISSPKRPAVSLSASPGDRANAAQSIMNAAMAEMVA